MDYQSLYDELHGAMADRHQMVEIARRFSDGNQSFIFRITSDGEIPLFLSSDLDNPFAGSGTRVLFAFGNYTLEAESPTLVLGGDDLWLRLGFAFGIIIVIALISAAIFARQMTSPLKSLVADTKRMAELRPVEPPRKRNDEIGDLAGDVHNMYDKLKDTI
jgi:two-component system sensor histidine kinase VanS